MADKGTTLTPIFQFAKNNGLDEEEFFDFVKSKTGADITPEHSETQGFLEKMFDEYADKKFKERPKRDIFKDEKYKKYLEDDDSEIVNDKSLDAIKDNFTPPGAKDEEEYYEDDGGRVYTWGELKKDIDDWVKKPDFGEQFANEDERKGYFNSDSTPNYRKIYKDFWDIGSNGAMSQISKDRAKELRDDIDTNDNGEIEVDEMADFQKSLDDYASKNKKGRDDIPVTTRR